jgi:hypothetical protein
MSETQRYWCQVDLLRLVDPTEASNTSSARQLVHGKVTEHNSSKPALSLNFTSSNRNPYGSLLVLNSSSRARNTPQTLDRAFFADLPDHPVGFLDLKPPQKEIVTSVCLSAHRWPSLCARSAFSRESTQVYKAQKRNMLTFLQSRHPSYRLGRSGRTSQSPFR